MTGFIRLRTRQFKVSSATLSRGSKANLWSIEIETMKRVFDEEAWEPRLYHQGLLLSAETPQQLSGLQTSSGQSASAIGVHPELCFLYVFGHEPVSQWTIKFGEYHEGTVPVAWSGRCDVSWDDEFGEDVPLVCECMLRLPSAQQIGEGGLPGSSSR